MKNLIVEKKIIKKKSNTNKYVRNIFRLNKEVNNSTMKDTIYFFRLKTNIMNLFEQEKNYHKPERVCKFWSRNYIEYEIEKK